MTGALYANTDVTGMRNVIRVKVKKIYGSLSLKKTMGKPPRNTTVDIM